MEDERGKMSRFSSQAGLATIRAGMGFQKVSKEEGGNPFNAVLGDKNKEGGPFNPKLRKRAGVVQLRRRRFQ